MKACWHTLVFVYPEFIELKNFSIYNFNIELLELQCGALPNYSTEFGLQCSQF